MVAVEEVCCLQSADNTLVLTRDAELVLRTPLKELIVQLDPQEFWQIHRGTVVNVRQIVSAHHDILSKVTLTLRDRPEKIAVSRSCIPSVPADVTWFISSKSPAIPLWQKGVRGNFPVRFSVNIRFNLSRVADILGHHSCG